MRAVAARNNKSTEKRLRFALVCRGITGWQIHADQLPGKPDFVFPQRALAVFVDGCFWHGCPRCGHFPKTNTGFWQAKILANKERDRKVNRQLRLHGIVVLRFWEHELRDDLPGCVQRILQLLNETTK